VKLPKVTSKAKVKATVRTTKAKPAAKVQPSKTKAASTLKRPSAETKAKILAAAKGTGRKRGPYKKKADAKENVKPKAGRGRWGGARTKTAKAAEGTTPKKSARGVKAGKK